MTERQLLTRNLSIIAHVDHGKTSLCDNLLAASGNLNEKHVGQCALDGALAESKERGITIVASAVALTFEVAREVVAHGRALGVQRMSALGLQALASLSSSSSTPTSSNDNDDDDNNEEEFEFHVENIPFEFDAERVRDVVIAAAPVLITANDLSIVLRKNHSARLMVTSALRENAATIAHWLSTVSTISDSEMRIQRSTGESVMSRVMTSAREQCDKTSDMPTFDVTPLADDENKFVCNGYAASSRRAARHAAALAWLSEHSPAPPTVQSELLPQLSSTTAAAATMLSVQVNLIDSPGHVDFSSEVTSALRLTDGAVVVVDAVEGIAAQTNSVLRQALRENVRCMLFVNKVDRAIEQQQLNSRALASKLETVIDGVNVALAGAQSALSFAAGTVVFGSALEGWAVSIDSFCALLASSTSNRTTTSANDISALRNKLMAGDEALFARVVLEPIYKLRQATSSGDVESAWTMLSKVGRAPTSSSSSSSSSPSSTKSVELWRELVEARDWKRLTRLALKLMFPLADALVSAVVRHLPSPLEAQRVRADVLYHQPASSKVTNNNKNNNNNDDEEDEEEEEEAVVEKIDESNDDVILRGIRLCDVDAPVMLFASKQISINARMYSIARLFSGRLRAGDELLVFDGGNNNSNNNNAAPRKAKVSALVVPSVRAPVRVDVAEAGSIVAIAGIALSGGTATSSASARALSSMRALVTDVVGVVLRLAPGAKGDARKKLIDGARALAASDVALRVVQLDDGGGLLLRGVGELHLEIALSRLRSTAGLASSAIEASAPVVAMRETVLRASTHACLGKSSNKLNRVYFTAEPVDAALGAELETLSGASEAERRAALLRHGFSASEAKRVLAIGGSSSASALLIDRTSGVSVAPIGESLTQAFKQLADAGVLASTMQPLTRVALVLVDCRYHADAKHRAPGDVVPAAVRAMSASLLSASMRLVEPDLRAEINCDARVANDVYAVLHRRGAVCGAAASSSSSAASAAGEQRYVTLSATLSVRQSIGLVGDLRGATKGQAFAALTPLGWRLVDSDPMESTSDAAQLIREARVRAGLASTDVPTAVEFEDRL